MKRRMITVCELVALVMTANADDNRGRREHRDARRAESHNYIIERQQAYQVQGPPTSRLIIGKRQIDGYKDYGTGTTVWYEGNHVVGVTR